MKMWILDRLSDISVWADGRRWRSWLIHGLVAAPMYFLVGPWATMVFWVLREGEQILHQHISSGYLYEPKYDYLLDIVAPWAVVILLSIAGAPPLIGG
jgi:hypothetical protein